MSSLELSHADVVETVAVAAEATAVGSSGWVTTVMWFFPMLILRLLRFVVVSLPSYVAAYFVALLGRQFSFTMTFSSLLVLGGIAVGAVWGLIRYRYLTKYSRLPPETVRQEPDMDIFVDTQGSDTKSGMSSYLDDFLSAIKVFGYLDRPVFHELTKQMKTYKLEAGEILQLQDEKGFAIVVDGSMQVFAKANVDEDEGPTSYKLGNQTYQLLSEVDRGAPISSLFSILSLFTEDVQLNENLRSSTVDLRDDVPPADIPAMSLDDATRLNTEKEFPFGVSPTNEIKEPAVEKSEAEKLAEEIIARATVTSTVAVIPEEAFRNLTRKYPKATAHIVQVILTRFQRLTFQTGHYYLGLTLEMFQPEILLNMKAKYDFPAYLRENAVRRLGELSKKNPDEPIVALSGEPKKKKKSPNAPAKRPLELQRVMSRQVILEPDESHPGDLLSNVPLSLREASPLPDAQIQKSLNLIVEDETEDSSLRASLAECIFQFLGLDGALMHAQSRAQSQSHSLQGSPMLASLRDDARTKPGLRKTGLGDLLNLNGIAAISESDYRDDDTSSIAASPNYENAQREAADIIKVMFYKAGTALCKQNERSEGLFYVIDGILEVSYKDRNGKKVDLYTVKPGGLGGFIGAVLGYRCFADITAKTDVYVGFMPKAGLERIADRYPMVYLNIAKTVTSVLSRLILNLDFGLEWVHKNAGQTIFNQDDDADSIYIVLNGRLRSFQRIADGKMEALAEFGQGDSIGELEVLTESKRPYSLHAIRDSELARIPRSLFESLALQHPSITFQISRLVASKVRKEITERKSPKKRTAFKTIGILPVTSGVPVVEFAQKLFNAYEDNKQKVVLLNNASVLGFLGRNAFNKMGRLKLSGYLADLEERFETMLYVADSNVSSVWTQACISQADCILLVADSMSDPGIGEYERLLVKMKTTARTELVLLYPDRYVVPGSTVKWLKNRIWVHAHHHVQMQLTRTQQQSQEPPMGLNRLQKLRNKVQTLQSELMIKYRSRRTPIYASNYLHKNDFNRLARILSGQAVGLVLGGGGARGISHIGVIRALEENGIPIDIVGGTSIGAFVGGLYAKDYDLVPIYGRAKKFAGRISSLWRMAFDLTYPATSYTTGHEFNRGIWKSFGDSRIEDFWLKYYTNTTNITHSRMEVHTSGYSWRYVRASMSLAGLLPPLTDKGSMLLDGGYVDNLTVEEMQNQGANVIFAVDVGSIDDTAPMSYGDSLSGLWVLFNRWNFFSKHPNVPNLAEIQQRLAYVSSVGALERAKATPGVFYLRPPIDDFATLDFAKFEQIYQVGTRYARDFISDLKKNDELPSIPGAAINKTAVRKVVQRRNSI